MTRATQAKYYSTRFFELAEALSKHPDRSIVFKVASKEEAKNFRLEFYAFRACAEKEGLANEFPELTAITVKVQGDTITVTHKDYTPSALALKEALEKVK